MHSTRAVLALVLTISSTAMATSCASSRPDDAARPERPSRPSRTLITREELTESSAADAYQAVQRLRPIWLRRTAASLGGPPADVLIYVDGQRFGASAALSRISINSIQEIRFHSPSDATQRWGTDHSGGVIEVITR